MHICPACITAAVVAAIGLKAFAPVIKAKIHQHWLGRRHRNKKCCIDKEELNDSYEKYNKT